MGIFSGALGAGLYTVTATHEYEPYGKTYTSNSTVPPMYQFTGYRLQNEASIGLYYAGARFYDPILMRFVSMDPGGQFYSPYVYGGGNPIIGADPNGELFWFLDPLTK